MAASEQLSLASRSVFYSPEESTQSISYPIFMSANYQYAGDAYDQVVDGARRDVNIYSRCGNPNEYKFDDQMAEIEGADSALAVASGMAAVSHAVLGLLRTGDHVVVDLTTYSSTHEFFDHRIQDFGISVTFVDSSDVDAVRAAFRPETRALYVETIANPTMKVAPLRALADAAHEHGIVVICDNTFASPVVCRPHEHGVDVVLESATKFIGGHNDAVGGIISLRSDILPADWLEQIRWNTLTKLGGALSPFNAWLLLRGIQTLPLRVERMSENAQKLVAWLDAHPAVRRVYYPGHDAHPQRALAAEQLDLPGAMLAFAVDSEEQAARVCKRLELASFAASLGGVRTVTQLPATMAFLDIPEEERVSMGITQGMIRVSVGIEGIDDLIADFAQALEA
ncbi:aminotransferase class I/II-fold pyridoxal phosphate-dependent enzyme [Microbacterium capsulatum]|uniref:Aminotransferase class I/II-fold pyridoxal phosphate-dependent enzyme n=1 Tax=Microbacterium capsulatum TaxID=3041921 RepID=A0ABU0XGV0_9MICO|nr:aminotransferase class I/II-fold pyridoxal phosphate-dependent enzyme [Microbacterium sp. ASV81]MDQ4214358.1 aminotransferase class I/II-fold pyridoxal phosphate-dependent enzyme [Microbacterium sp. ASV81]